MNKKQYILQLLRKAYSRHIHKHYFQGTLNKAKNNSLAELTRLAKETTDKLTSVSSLVYKILDTKINPSTNL
jgi:hypothetical protein